MEGGGRWKKLIWQVVKVEFRKWQAGQSSWDVRLCSEWAKLMNSVTTRKVKRKIRLRHFNCLFIIFPY